MGYINIGREALEEFQVGQGTVGAASAVLVAANLAKPILKYVIIKADLTNTDDVFVGTASVTASTGFRLDAGEVTPPIHIDDLSKVYVIGGAASQGYSWLAV
jgi:hypothetical protein